MSTIIVFKALTAPVLILFLTLLIRRFGPVVGGLAMGVPLVTGPISVFTALEHGPAFGRHAAVANLVGQVSTLLFCAAFALSATRFSAWTSAACGIAVFAAGTLIWNQITWMLLPATLLLLATVALLAKLMPNATAASLDRLAPWWDLPARMIVSTAFIFAITQVAGLLGPQTNGLIAPFPVFVLILAVFTHLQHGGIVAMAMMRGVIFGSLAFAAFFVVIALMLGRFGLPATYGTAVLASLIAAGTVYLLTHRPIRRWPWTPAS